MSHPVTTTAVALGVLAMGCAPARSHASGDDARQATMTVDRLPEEATRTYFDFGGKVSLVGYQATPARDAAPRDTIDVRLYWRSNGHLSKGWRLFTHLDNARGEIIGNYDQAGPLRGSGDEAGLTPDRWQPGKIYVDELHVEVPSPDNRPVTDRITLVAGVWRRNMRLDVRGGPARDQAAVVTHFRTGIVPKTPKADAP